MGWWSSVDWGQVAGAVGSVWAADRAADAAKGAGKAAAAGSEAATALQRDIYADQRALNMPFYNAQIAATNQYNALLGLPALTAQPQAGMGGGSFGTSTPTQWFGTKGVTPNPQLYAQDPRYRAAWDSIAQQQRRKYGEGFNSHSTQKGWIDRLQQAYYAQPAPQQTGGNAPATPAQPAMTQQQAFDAFRNTPGYQFGMDQGVKALDASAAARGGLFSGKAGQDLFKFGRDYSDQQGFTPYMNRLASAAGIGQVNPVGNLQSAAGNYGSNAGQFMQNAANARASGMQNAANARYQGWSDAAGFLGQWYGDRG